MGKITICCIKRVYYSTFCMQVVKILNYFYKKNLKMKKNLTVFLVTLMVLTFCACSNKGTEDKETVNDTIGQTNVTQSNDNEEETKDTKEHNNDTEEQAKDTEKQTVDNEEHTDNNDTAEQIVEQDTDSTATTPEGINPVTTSLEAPANIGDWLETKRYSSKDDSLHTVYFRITDIIRYNDEVQAILDAYNDEGHLFVFNPIEDQDIEYCLFKYEVYFPEDFPQHEWGITNVKLSFMIDTVDGAGISANGKTYIGLSLMTDISKRLDLNELYSGQTFKDGMGVFAMVKGYSDYLVKSYYYEDNQKFSSYIKGK